jgi:HEPN superfamily Swt1-like protein
MARTNSDVLAALPEKLGGVTLQAVQQRRARIQALVDMPADIATYIVAQREGVKTNRWLDAETLQKVAEFDAMVRAREQGSGAVTPTTTSSTKAKKARPATRNVTIGGNATIPPGALNPTHAADAKRMADEVYPMLYVFENSVREFIDGHLTAAYGKDWHLDPQTVRTPMREKVERNRNSEAKTRYHSSRQARFVYYTDIGDLVHIASSRNGVKVLQPMFPSASWFPSIVEKIEASRHVVAHMNPVQKRDIDRIRMNLEDWLDQIKDHPPP